MSNSQIKTFKGYMKYIILIGLCLLACKGARLEIKVEPTQEMWNRPTHRVGGVVHTVQGVRVVLSNIIFEDASGDNVLNPGERGRLNFRLRNTGVDTAKRVFMILRAIKHSELVTLPERYELGDILPNSEKTGIIEIVARPCNTTTKVPIEVIFGETHGADIPGCTLSVIVMPIKFIKVVIVNYDVKDKPVLGSPNGVIDAGESIVLQVLLKNKGNTTCQNMNILITSKENIKFNPSEFNIESLPQDGITNISTEFYVPYFYEKHKLEIVLDLVAKSLNYKDKLLINLEVKPSHKAIYNKIKEAQ